jgi:imidazolonepropionase-like amidohydrolase
VLIEFALVALTRPFVPVVAIENVSVIEPGKSVARSHRTVVIANGVFAQVGDFGNTKIPGGARRIDGTGKFLMPGLWDMHVHWYDEKGLGLFTANGVTGMRVMYGQPEHVAWRTKATAGKMIGPRIYLGSPIVDGPKPMWPGSFSMRSPKDAPGIVAKIKAGKYDFVKVYSFMSRESYLALVAEAKKQGLPFEGHVPLPVTPLQAAKLGQSSLEHLDGLRESSSKNSAMNHERFEEAMLAKDPMATTMKMYKAFGRESFRGGYDSARAKQLVSDLAKTHMWMCPTLVVLRSTTSLDQPDFLKDPRLKYMSAEMRTLWQPANDFRLKARTKADWDWWREDTKAKLDMVMPLKRAGNRFLAGTDCLNPYCFPGFSLHDELAMFVELGFTPAEALETATLNPARFMGRERTMGTIARGKLADAVLLDRNPLIDIHNTKSINTVIQGGKVYSRKELDAILKSNEHPMK